MHYLGIDWATDKHDLCLMAPDGRVLSQFEITHDMAGFTDAKSAGIGGSAHRTFGFNRHAFRACLLP